MSEVKRFEGHTQGPWMVGSLPPPKWRYIVNSGGEVVAAVAEWNESGDLIQEFCGKAAKTNAQLIAAAPDLLAENATLEARLQKMREALSTISALMAETHIKLKSVHIPGYCPKCIADAALADSPLPEVKDENNRR